MAKKSGLGRGLGALLSENSFDSAGTTILPITEIEPNRSQPRTDFDEEALNELAESIGQHGVLQPLLVRPMPNGTYQIVAGERRWRASRLAGLTELPVVIRQLDDEEVMLLALIENLQREQLNPLEEAEGYKALRDEYGFTQEMIAEKVGKSRPAVANALRLLSLPENITDLLKDNSISTGHAKVLLSVADPAKQQEIAELIVRNDLSVRETEKLAAAMAKEKPEATKKQNRKSVLEAEAGKLLCDSLGRKVKVTHGAKKGVIEIEYYGEDDLKELTRFLCNVPRGTNK